MQSLRQRIFGFDVRENWLRYDDVWNQERRNQFLFNEDVEKPISADDLAWPGLLSPNGLFSLSHSDPDFASFEGFNDPELAGRNVPLWEDADAMCRFFAARWKFEEKPWCSIALTEISHSEPVWRGDWPIPNQTVPNTVRDDWQFLGIDVCANDGLYSGIINCGYSADEKTFAAAKWKHSVNKYHLFDGMSEADEFRSWSDNRVREHAPFRLIGVILVSANNGTSRGIL